MSEQTIKTPAISLWGDRVLVEVIKEKEKSTGGIIIPTAESEDGKTYRATVVKMAKTFEDNIQKEPNERLKIGDVVLLSQFAGSDVKIGLDKYKVLRATDIIGVLHEDIVI